MLFALHSLHSLVSIRNYIALKPGDGYFRAFLKFSIHTKLHRSKTLLAPLNKLYRLVSIRNYIALKQMKYRINVVAGLVSIRNYIALKQECLARNSKKV